MPFDVKMPDGTIIRNVPDGTTKADIQRRYQAAKPDTRPKSFWQGFGDELQKAGSNATAFQERFNPFLLAATTAMDLTGYGDKKLSSQMDLARLAQQRQSKYQGSTAGKIAGGIVGSAPLMLAPQARVGAAAAPYINAAIQGAASGMLLTDDRSAKGLTKAGGIGALAGPAGQLVGSKVIAPIIASKAGQAVLAPVKAALNTLPRINIGNAPRLTRPERMVAPTMEPARQNLEDAARLGLPYALADASEQARALAGSAARFSPNARQMAADVFPDRAMGTRQRAIDAMDRELAPVTDIAERSADLKKAAWDTADPLYREAFDQQIVMTPELQAMLDRPAGRAALASAKSIADNSGKSSTGMGLIADDMGNVRIGQTPTGETLDMVKRGFDQELAPYRIPGTNKLDLEGNPEAQSINTLLQQYKAAIDELNPLYREARQAYQGAISPRTALQTGYNILPKPGLPSRDTARIIEGIAPENLPEAARGYVTARADEIGRMSQGNPYKAVYGSLDEQAKLHQLFPEEGVANFERQAALEADMGKTYTETLGGSATQPRAIADAQFEGMAPAAIAAGVDLMGGGGAATAANLARRGLGSKLADRYRMGFGAQKKAEELAPILFNTNPQVSLELMTEIARRQAAIEGRKQSYGRALGIFGAPAALAGGSSF